MGVHHLTSVYFVFHYIKPFPYLFAVAQMVTLTHLSTHFMCLFIYKPFPQPKIFFLSILTKSNPHSPTDQMTLSPLLQPGEGLLRVHLQLLFMPRKRQRRKGWREVCCYGFLLQQTWWCQAGGTPEKKTFFKRILELHGG